MSEKAISIVMSQLTYLSKKLVPSRAGFMTRDEILAHIKGVQEKLSAIEATVSTWPKK